jgi:hypothetical protein
MPTPTVREYRITYPTTGTTIDSVWIDDSSFTSIDTTQEARPNIFRIENRSTEAENELLQAEYPEEIFQYDFRQPMHSALTHYIHHFKSCKIVYDNFRTLVRVLNALQETPGNNAQFLSNVASNYPRSVRSEIINGTVGESIDYSMHEKRDLTVSRAHTYLSKKQQWFDLKSRYGTKQAEYYQRRALLRARPPTIYEVDVYKTAAELAEWPNVFAVRTRITDQYAEFRIGLCNIEMSESATDSYYSNPVPIKLAPFYFTLRLKKDGKFLCPSQEDNAGGFAFDTPSPSVPNYYFHPHQLNDSPCFGSFGQALNNFASMGEVTALISGIIAFYSQYNSQDSAGAKARFFHPSNLPMSNFDSDLYLFRLKDHITDITCTTDTLHYIDDTLLLSAMSDYLAYSRDSGDPPVPAERHYCYNCNEEPVGDGYEYMWDVNENRICIGCWNDNYCCECERHIEDCECVEN